MKTALISIIQRSAKDLKLLKDTLSTLGAELQIVRMSSIYESLSEGVSENISKMSPLGQALIMCVLVKYNESAKDLANVLKDVQKKEEEKWEVGQLYIHVLAFEKEISMLPSLTLPHPDLHNRAELLIPSAEIYPSYEHPVLEQTLTELQSQLDMKERLVFYARSNQVQDLS